MTPKANKNCSEDDCPNTRHAYGLCRLHFDRACYHSDPDLPRPRVECVKCRQHRVHRAKGLCPPCYSAEHGQTDPAKLNAIWDAYLTEGSDEWTDERTTGGRR